MKNVIKSIIALLTLTSAFVVSGCSDITNGTKHEQDSLQGCTVSGKVFLSSTSGATTSQLFSTSSSARTAVASFSEKDSLTYSVGAKYADETAKIPDEIGSFDTETMTYSIKFTKTGEWTIVVEAIADAYKLLEGKTTVSINSVFGDVQINPITMYPQASSDKTGSVVLSVTDQSTKIKSVSATAIYGGNAAIDETKLTGYKNFTDGVADINMPGVPAGEYDVTFCFNDAENGAGNTLYKCKETVNVYSGFATDTWYGTSPHMTRNTDGTYSFVITDNLISGYGTETVPDTQMVLYTLAAGGDNYDYHLVSDVGTTVSDSTKTASNAASSYNSFCFDSNGYFYAITNISGSATYIKSDKTDFGSNTASSNDGAMYLYGNCGSMITCDTKTDIIYLFVSSNAAITQVTKDDGSYTYNATNSCYEPAKVYSVSSEDSNHSIVQAATAFAVYDGIVYCAALDSDGGKLAIINLNDADADNQVTVSKTVGLGLSLDPSDAKITDMLYQDGAVYILYREVSVSTVGIYSRGAVIRYDTVFGSTKIMGYADTEKKFSEPIGTDSDTGESIYAKLPAYYNGTSQLFTDSSLKNPLYVPFNTSWTYGSNYTLYDVLPFYTPTLNEENLSDEAFYGPVKFIAVKPKKLVIADDGLAFYTDADGVTKYRNVNRVVTVDLESFSIIESETANVTLSGDDSDLKTVLAASTSTSYQTALSTFFTTSKYYKNDENIFDTNETYYAQLGIPCGE